MGVIPNCWELFLVCKGVGLGKYNPVAVVIFRGAHFQGILSPNCTNEWIKDPYADKYSSEREEAKKGLPPDVEFRVIFPDMMDQLVELMK